MSIEQARGTAGERAALEQLSQLYVYDFIEFLAPERRPHLGDDGRFPPVPELDGYWTEADRSVWFLRAEGVLCGFALLNGHAHCGLPVDFNVGEYCRREDHQPAEPAGRWHAMDRTDPQVYRRVSLLMQSSGSIS